MSAIKKIEAALAAGPVEGNWHWDDDENMYPTPRNYELDMFPEAIIQTDGGHYGPDAPTRAYIVAVQPVAIREVLQTLASKEAELVRLREALEWYGAIGTAISPDGLVTIKDAGAVARAALLTNAETKSVQAPPEGFYPDGIAHLQPTIRVACVTLDGVTLTCPIGELESMFSEDDDSTYTLTFKTMTVREYEALGEFDGF